MCPEMKTSIVGIVLLVPKVFRLEEFHCMRTLKPVYKDHTKDQVIVASTDRGFSCRGVVALLKGFPDQLLWPL